MEMKTTTLRLPNELYERLREEAFKTRKSINQIVTEALQKELEK